MLFFQNYSNLYPPNKTLCALTNIKKSNKNSSNSANVYSNKQTNKLEIYNIDNDILDLNLLQLKNNEYHFVDKKTEEKSLKNIENLSN